MWSVMIALGVILDIVVWRKRQAGLLIFYFELCMFGLLSAMPFNFGYFQ